MAEALISSHAVTPLRAETLARRYGNTARDVLAGAASWPDDCALQTAPLYSTGEIAWLARHERVTRLENVILRRTLLAFEGLARRACVSERHGRCGSAGMVGGA